MREKGTKGGETDLHTLNEWERIAIFGGPLRPGSYPQDWEQGRHLKMKRKDE